ncbi:transmembrane amino acid transporter protein-domain-containing protein [Dichotomocladium elegans]|nr:transmembrane amino acid transporter protein-domain-containing protein [Dichotomocladium elegans]
MSSNYGTIPKKHLTKAERDLLQADRPGYGNRSKVEVAFNLVNATVGAGIIGLPFAISHAGFVTGIAASIWVAVLSQLGLYMLILAGKHMGIYKFAVLVENIMGRFGYHFLNFMIVVQAGGSVVSYFILLGDTLPVLFERYVPMLPLLANRTLVITVIGIFCILPLTFPRSIGSLARWSMVSVMCLPIIIATIVIRAPAYYDRLPNHGSEGAPAWSWVGSDVFGALGIMAFAFSSSQVAFNNFLSLSDQSHASWRASTALATGMSWLVSMTFAIIGWLAFGADVKSNLFMNFDSDDFVVNIGRFALGVSMIFSIPMGFHPTREAVQKMLGFETATRQPTELQHYAVTGCLFVFLMIAGIAVRSLGKVYSLVGGFSATTLAYILPATAYLVTRWRTLSSLRSHTLTVAPTLTVTPTTYSNVYYSGNGKFVDDKTSLLLPHNNSFDAQSCSSPRLGPAYAYSFYDEEDVSTVDGTDMLADEIDDAASQRSVNSIADHMERPVLGFHDIISVILILWGFFVMVTSISGTLSGP